MELTGPSYIYNRYPVLGAGGLEFSGLRLKGFGVRFGFGHKLSAPLRVEFMGLRVWVCRA